MNTLQVKSDKEMMRRRRAYEQHYDETRTRSLIGECNAPARHIQGRPGPNNDDWDATLDKMIKSNQDGMLLVVGRRGGGKTQMAVECMKSRMGEGLRAYYATAIEFFMAVKATYRKDGNRTEQDVIKEYRRPHLLVLDEITKRSDSSWENALLFELIDKRYGDMKGTIMVSNAPEAVALKSLGDSISSRLSETGGIVQCNWKSFR